MNKGEMIMALQLFGCCVEKNKNLVKKDQVAVKRIWLANVHRALHKNEKEGWHKKMRRG